MNDHVLSRRWLLGCVAAGCALAFPRRARSQTPVIHAGATFADGFAELFYADALGTLKKSALDVVITKFPSGPTMMPALLGGSLDVGISDTVSLGTAIAKGAPFVLIAGAGLHRSSAPEDALCVAIDSPIKTPHDLIGKTVGVLGLHGITEIALWSWLDRNKIEADRLSFVELPLTQMAGALERGTVAAGFLAEPFLSQNRDKTVRVLSVPFDAIAPQFLISSWFTSRPYLQANRELVARLVDVIYETARWANAHQHLSAPILAGVAGVPVATVLATTRIAYGTSLDQRLLDPVFGAMYKYGVIPRPLTAAEVSALHPATVDHWLARCSAPRKETARIV
jgi:NitT/TauT family transport system substrate-binding protein